MEPTRHFSPPKLRNGKIRMGLCSTPKSADITAESIELDYSDAASNLDKHLLIDENNQLKFEVGRLKSRISVIEDEANHTAESLTIQLKKIKHDDSILIQKTTSENFRLKLEFESMIDKYKDKVQRLQIELDLLKNENNTIKVTLGQLEMTKRCC